MCDTVTSVSREFFFDFYIPPPSPPPRPTRPSSTNNVCPSLNRTTETNDKDDDNGVSPICLWIFNRVFIIIIILFIYDE